MIGLPSETRVWLASGPTDMRRGFDGLALLVQETLKRDPHCGHLFVFRGKRGGLIKVLWHDGQGMCLFAKRLERGRFMWPRTEGEAVTITPAQLGDLVPQLLDQQRLMVQLGTMSQQHRLQRLDVVGEGLIEGRGHAAISSTILDIRNY